MRGLESMSRYKPLFIYVPITLFTWMLSFILEENEWKYIASLDTSTAIALAILAFLGYLEYVRLEDTIEIYFKVCEEEIETGLTVLRKNCTRSEVLGILGMMQTKNGRYEIAYLKDKNLLTNLNNIQKNRDIRLIIPLSKKELEQFCITLEQKDVVKNQTKSSR